MRANYLFGVIIRPFSHLNRYTGMGCTRMNTQNLLKALLVAVVAALFTAAGASALSTELVSNKSASQVASKDCKNELKRKGVKRFVAKYTSYRGGGSRRSPSKKLLRKAQRKCQVQRQAQLVDNSGSSASASQTVVDPKTQKDDNTAKPEDAVTARTSELLCTESDYYYKGSLATGGCIIAFKDKSKSAPEQLAQLSQSLNFTYSYKSYFASIQAVLFTAELSESQFDQIANDPAVSYIEPNYVVTTS